MDGSELSAVVAASARAVYGYLEDMQWVTDPPLGMSETRVTGVDVSDGYAVLHLASRLSDASGLVLKVGARVLGEEAAGFTRYDEISRTIVVRPGREVLDELSAEDVRVSVLSDMKFLVQSVAEFYGRYGDLIRVPDAPATARAPVFPGEPTDQQRRAAEGISGDRLAYVWGAPGTGKTQFVLAACIRGCLEAGERVAVFAPTNNSVEQVLRGVLASFGDDVPDGIVRLGIPTKEFLRDHPEMCEDRQAQRRLDGCSRSISNLEEVLYERMCDSVRGDVDALLSAGEVLADAREVVERGGPMADSVRRVSEVCSRRPETSSLLADGVPLHDAVERVRDSLYVRDRPAADIEEYLEWSDADIVSEIADLRAEEDALRRRSTGNRIASASIVAGTPHQFISRFRPKGSPEDQRMELDVDRIFLDEAGYCGLVQALALFSNGVPVVMLGDHMQLPPVSQLDDGLLRERAQSGGPLSEAFLWNMPALYSEAMLLADIEDVRAMYIGEADPPFGITGRYDLTESRRFGAALGRVLDRYVYRNGMRGNDGSDIEIRCIDATCDSRENRENRGEAEAVADFLRNDRPDPKDVCILSPYTAQCRLLKSRVGRRYADCVMTVHGSQGREWDIVVLSVADNGVVSRDVPYRFTSSETPMGLRVMNTAVSRARRRLVVVCDAGFWSAREGELVGGLIEAAGERVTRARCPAR